ncbi:MAG TPA: amino acid ABC transporter permease [Nocardioides sp.]|jgi:polar amino acid transport system permease protein|nr:amino acid ABC transporter permease [Nocardioides sp.]
MSTSSLVNEELQPSPTPAPPRPVFAVAMVGLVFAVVVSLVMVKAVLMLRHFNHDGPVSTTVGVILVVLTLYAWYPAAKALGAGQQRASLLSQDQLVPSRRIAARGREDALIAMGYAAAGLIVALLLIIVLAKDGGVATTFFALHPIRLSFNQVIHAFWINIWVACVSEVLVLILGLVVAIVRMLPGRAGAPLRMIAMVYCDIFRAIPAIVVIMLIVFGLPLTGVRFFQTMPLTWLGIIALTLTYSAYVSEVYRAGLASIHPSQSAAARSLGLSYTQTLRTVLVPQAVRRVIPPLLNDFISLQKDTALLSVAAISEALLVAKLWEAQLFNLSPIALVAAFFIIITIPQARFVDYLIDRDAARRAGK